MEDARSTAPNVVGPKAPPIWRWMLATSLASVIGLQLSLLIFVAIVLTPELRELLGLQLLVVFSSRYLGLGLAIGSAQYFFLRGSVRIAILWAIVTAIGLPTGWRLSMYIVAFRSELGIGYDAYRILVDSVGVSAFSELEFAFRALAPGFSVGLLQWLFFRKRTGRTLFAWLAASSVAWAGFPLFARLSIEVQLRQGYIQDAASTDLLRWLVEPLAAGLWVGLLLGVVFRKVISGNAPIMSVVPPPQPA